MNTKTFEGKFSSLQRRHLASVRSQYKPGDVVQFSHPVLGEKTVTIEYVDLIYVTANYEYPSGVFLEDSFEYGVMVLNDRGFAIERIRARSSELHGKW